MLYIVPTPIGNLQDITLRAIDTLKKSDLILCEDSRQSLVLLKHFSISTPLKSYHKFNETKTLSSIIEILKQGKVLSLISDAGTPAISDPGQKLIETCHQESIEVCALPGPSAALCALSASGFNSENFHFGGFLPKKREEKKRVLIQSLIACHPSIFYESPKRLLNTLEMIEELDPERELFFARELTKKFETLIKNSTRLIKQELAKKDIKGECVLIIGPCQETYKKWEDISPKEHMDQLKIAFGISQKDAIKITAQMRDIPKRTLYQKWHGK